MTTPEQEVRYSCLQQAISWAPARDFSASEVIVIAEIFSKFVLFGELPELTQEAPE